MEAAHRVAKNTGILYARMAITVFISLYSTRLILSALGVSDFGLFNVVGGAIAMLGFLNGSMAAATQRFMSFAQGAGDLEKVKRIFNMSTVLHAGIAVLMVLVLEIAGYFFLNGILNIAPDRIEVAKIIYHFMVASTFFTVLSVPYEAVITSHENMLFYAILGILESVLKLGIALYITYSAFDHLVAYGFLMAALSIFLLILRRIYCHRYYVECVLDFRKYYEKTLMKEISSFAGWSLLGTASSMIANYGIALVINIFFGTVINAANAIAGQLTGQLSVFANTMLKALNPIITKSEGSGNRQLMLKATMMGCKLSFFLLAFLFIPAIIEMPFILKLWIKNVPSYAVIFCILALLRNQIDQLYMSLQSSIAAVGNIRKYQTISSTLNVAPIIVSYILFYLNLQPYFIFIVFSFFSIINGMITINYAKINCNLVVSVFVKNVILRSSISFITIFIIVYFSSLYIDNSYIKFIVTISISTISFPFILWFLGFNREEKEKLIQVFQIFSVKFKLIKFNLWLK
jgi:O-antigen/teichoic acid export membrane protein